MLRIASMVASLAFVVAVAPAAAQELPPQNVCVGQSIPKPPPTEAEKEQANLENWASQRAEFGFRADIPYVKELVKRGVWEYDVGYIPVTPAENRYLKLRDRLTLGPRAERYLRAHRDIDGGFSVEDDWPREPYLLLHLKRDVAKHLAAIKQLARFPRNLRAERVKYSDRELEKIADRMWKDQKALAAEGFHLSGTGHAADGYLHVDLITKRTDFKAYFKKRYGDALKIEIEATELYSFQCTGSGSYRVAEDGMSLTVTYSTGGGNQFARMEVTEFPDHVEVGVVEKVYNGSNTADLRSMIENAPLSAPLGDRPVVDAYNRKTLQQVGSRPGQPPCPAKPAEPTRLEQAIAQRAEYGMRADPGYVQASTAALPTPRPRRAGSRCLNDIDQGDEETLDFNLWKQFPKTYAGSVFVTQYPKPPLVVYRFTKDARSHLAAIRKKSKHPENARVATGTVTRSELEELEEKIRAAFEQTRTLDGFFVVSVYEDRATESALIRVVTARTDAQPYFAAKFGPHVRTEVIGDRVECYLDARTPTVRGPEPVRCLYASGPGGRVERVAAHGGGGADPPGRRGGRARLASRPARPGGRGAVVRAAHASLRAVAGPAPAGRRPRARSVHRGVGAGARSPHPHAQDLGRAAGRRGALRAALRATGRGGRAGRSRQAARGHPLRHPLADGAEDNPTPRRPRPPMKPRAGGPSLAACSAPRSSSPSPSPPSPSPAAPSPTTAHASPRPVTSTPSPGSTTPPPSMSACTSVNRSGCVSAPATK